MAFSAPAEGEDPLVVDFGATNDLYSGSPHRDALLRQVPGLVLRCIALGEACQAWGGLLSGLTIAPENHPWKFAHANQGALVFTLRIDLFLDPAAFKREMGEYVRRIRELQP